MAPPSPRRPAVGFIFVTLVLSIVGFGLLIPVLPKLVVQFQAGDIADVTPPEKRAGAFGLIGAAFGLGFVIGPAAGGFLGNIDLRLPFWFAAGCSTLNLLYGFFMLPESLPLENRRAFAWKRANPIGALQALKRFPSVLGLAESYFILMVAQSMLFSTWALYTDHRYHWNPLGVGLSLMFSGVLSGLVQAVLVKRIVPRLGETRSVVIGFGISAAAYVAYGLASSGWMIYVIMAFGAFAGLAGPALQSYITRHVPANEQGAVQGVYSGLASLAAIPGPFIATWSFGLAIAPDNRFTLPGIAFFEGALFVLIALILAVRCFRRDAANHPATTVA
jgi:DHA1 family tetracycline resistance protein-like MFS transporter